MKASFVLMSAAVVSAQESTHWKPIDSPDFDKVTEALGVGFAKDGQTGFCGVGIDGVGTQILKTTNAGVNWQTVWPDEDTKQPFNLFLATAVRDPKHAVVTGALAQAYTTDGIKFQDSSNDYLEPSQDAGVLPGGKFAIVNSGGSKNGVATSREGNIWTAHELGTNSSIFAARYGAYPTNDIWYVTAGTFPTGLSEDEMDLTRINEKLAVSKKGAGMRLMREHLNNTAVPCEEDPQNCYAAAVYKTTDGGDSFTQVWSDTTSNIYPNGIHCANADQCVAVLEGDTCRIIVTTDGGATWEETLHDDDSACSLTYAHMINDKQVWVAGGHMQRLNFEGRFFQSLDGGMSWEKEVVNGLYIFDLDLVSETDGFALGLSVSGNGVTLLGYVA